MTQTSHTSEDPQNPYRVTQQAAVGHRRRFPTGLLLHAAMWGLLAGALSLLRPYLLVAFTNMGLDLPALTALTLSAVTPAYVITAGNISTLLVGITRQQNQWRITVGIPLAATLMITIAIALPFL